MQYQALESFNQQSQNLITHYGNGAWALNNRLLSQLQAESFYARSAKLTVVCAPMGYRKAPTVAAWVGNNPDQVRWVRMTPQTVDAPHTLWNLLASELRNFIGQAETKTPHNTTNLAEVQTLASRLKTPLTIVINKYHYATTPDNDLALAEFSASAPLLSLVIIGRRVAMLDSLMVAAQTRVRVISAEDLALSHDDTNALVTSLGVPHSTELQEALTRANGWPIAVAAALQLGSDDVYINTSTSRAFKSTNTASQFNPIQNLNSFAQDLLELLATDTKNAVLAAAQLAAISDHTLTEAFKLTPERAAAVISELLELGMLTKHDLNSVNQYVAHPAVKSPLSVYAQRTIGVTGLATLYSARAKELQHSDPFTAFNLFLTAQDYAAAEIVAAHHFNLITDETQISQEVLSTIPEKVLTAHPTITAALFFLQMADTTTPSASLQRIAEIWFTGLNQENDKLNELVYLLQLMVCTRVTGQFAAAVKLLTRLVGKISPAHIAPETQVSEDIHIQATDTFYGTLPTYLIETAETALTVGDFALARRHLAQLRKYAEHKIQQPWKGFSYSTQRTVSDPESGTRWLLAALGVLAYTEVLDGDLRSAAEAVTEYDRISAESGLRAAGLSWLDLEIARGHIAAESQNQDQLTRASNALSPLHDRFYESYILIAHSVFIRYTQGPTSALAKLQAGMQDIVTKEHVSTNWLGFCNAVETMLCTTIGDIASAERLLASEHITATTAQVEKVRLDLYSSNDTAAFVNALRLGESGLTIRQSIDCKLMLAVSGYNCQKYDIAFAALCEVAADIQRYNQQSRLLGVPHEMLRNATLAAIDRETETHGSNLATLNSLLTTIDEIPVAARTRRFEQLTQMEKLTLDSVAKHLSIDAVAKEMFVTPATVKKHLSAVNRKLGTKNRDEAILQARLMRLID